MTIISIKLLISAFLVIAVCEVARVALVIADMIDRKKDTKTLHNAFIDSLRKDNKQYAEELLKEFLESDKQEPVVFPTPHGRAGIWNVTNEANLWKCSNCGLVIYSETERDITFNHAYCGRCGAEMSSFRKQRGES